jgi:hypothetical protein
MVGNIAKICIKRASDGALHYYRSLITRLWRFALDELAFGRRSALNA